MAKDGLVPRIYKQLLQIIKKTNPVEKRGKKQKQEFHKRINTANKVIFKVISRLNFIIYFLIDTAIGNVPMVVAGFTGSLSDCDKEKNSSPCHQPEMDLWQELSTINLFLLKSPRICVCSLMQNN